jgi:HAD superfamily hydrolase (TIGR01509 family)
MPADAVIFDLDGTLIDVNLAHLEAWRRAFAANGYDVPRERILPEVGKGGDLLVPAILGADVNESLDRRIREAHGEEFLATAARERFPVFPAVEELLLELRRRGIPTALATSSDDRYVDATMRSAGRDLREHFAVATTKDDADASKPRPDIVVAAVERLGVDAHSCVMLGDTRHDGTACRAAGVAFVGLLCGGTSDERALRDAGARLVLEDPAEALARLDEVLALVDQGSAPAA